MILDALMEGAGLIVRPDMLVLLFVGSIVGLIFGALPGLSALTGMALALPFTFGMDPLAAMLIYAGIISVAPLGGALPAILLNTPGTPQNIVSAFDGYPMSQRGEGPRAIAIASTSCMIGTLIGVLILLAFLPFLRSILLNFRAPEIFWMVIFGLVALSGVSGQSSAKGLVAGGMGLLLGMIGWNNVFSGTRFTGGSLYLWDGIQIIPFFVGLLAVSELLVMASRGGQIARVGDGSVVQGFGRQSLQGIIDVLKRPVLVARSSVIGTGVGIVPGAGGAIAALVSYAMAKRLSRDWETYGKGNVEGLIAAEVSNDAKEGGSLLPTISFGIPGSPDMAILLGALVMHGLQPGPLLLTNHMGIVVMLILGIVAAQVVASLIVLFGSSSIAYLTRVNVKILVPLILTLCLAGTYSIRENPIDMVVTILAGFLGFYMKRYDYPLMPLALGFVLVELLEQTYHQSLMMSMGSYHVFVSSGISIVLMTCTTAILLWTVLRWFNSKWSVLPVRS